MDKWSEHAHKALSVSGSVAVAEDRIETVKRNFMEIDGDATR